MPSRFPCRLCSWSAGATGRCPSAGPTPSGPRPSGPRPSPGHAPSGPRPLSGPSPSFTACAAQLSSRARRDALGRSAGSPDPASPWALRPLGRSGTTSARGRCGGPLRDAATGGSWATDVRCSGPWRLPGLEAAGQGGSRVRPAESRPRAGCSPVGGEPPSRRGPFYQGPDPVHGAPPRLLSKKSPASRPVSLLLRELFCLFQRRTDGVGRVDRSLRVFQSGFWLLHLLLLPTGYFLSGWSFRNLEQSQHKGGSGNQQSCREAMGGLGGDAESGS